MERISEDIITNVKWSILFYVFACVMLLWVIKLTLEFSLSDFVVSIISEFKGLAGAKIERGPLNALGIVSMTALIFLFNFSDSFKNLVDMLGLLKDGKEGSPVLTVATIFFLGVFSLLSIWSVRKS